MQVQNVSFKGYKNVIASATKFKNADVAFISMQLNNKGVSSDLEKWQAIQRRFFPQKSPNDVLTVMHINEEEGGNFRLLLNERPLALNKDEFLISQEEEKPMMKFFILLRSITERIMNEEKKEWHFAEIADKIIPHNVDVLRDSFVEPAVGAAILTEATFPVEEKDKAVASIFYNSIDDYMDGYVDHLERTGM